MTTITETDRLIIRTFHPADTDAAHAWLSDPEVARYSLWDVHSREQSEARIRDRAALTPPVPVGHWAEYAIALKPTNRAIGSLSLKIEDDVSWQAEIGWVLHPHYQGQGLATEAARALMLYAIPLGVHRFSAVADPRNTASIRVMERLGMRQEGYFRESCFSKGEWTDDIVYGVLASEVEPGHDNSNTIIDT